MKVAYNSPLANEVKSRTAETLQMTENLSMGTLPHNMAEYSDFACIQALYMTENHTEFPNKRLETPTR